MEDTSFQPVLMVFPVEVFALIHSHYTAYKTAKCLWLQISPRG